MPAPVTPNPIVAWLDSYQHAIVICVGLICATVAGICIPAQRWAEAAAWLTNPATATALGGVGVVLVGLYRRARGLAPLLVLALLGSTVSACGASVPAIIGVAEVVVDGTCIGAEKLCELSDPACGSGACHAFHDICPALDPSAPVQVSCSSHTGVDAGTP